MYFYIKSNFQWHGSLIMIQIFLSHSYRDSDLVDKAELILEAEGQIKCWNFRMDSNILVPIPPDVASAIDTSDYFLLFWSKSVANRMAWVQEELFKAQDIEIARRNLGDQVPFIFIVNLDSTPLPNYLQGRKVIKFPELQKLKEAILKAPQRKQSNNVLMESVSSIMTPQNKLLMLSTQDKLIDAFILMETADVRHLVINNNDGTVAGFMSHRPIRKRIPPRLGEIKKVNKEIDVAEYQRAISDAGNIPISKIMTPFHNLIYLGEEHNLVDAIETLTREYEFGRISAFPVLKGRVAVGIVSYLDLLCKLNIPEISVELLKKKDGLFWCYTSTLLKEVYTTMSQANIRHMPILNDDGNLEGLIDDITVSWLLHPIYGLQNYPVEHFMKTIKSAGYFRDSDTLETVVTMFCMDKDTTALPVADDTNGFLSLTGMLSYIDILKSLRESR